MTQFNILIAYSTLAVFDAALSEPFNDWTRQHVGQGFSWRVGSVSFRTLVESGAAEVNVKTSLNSPTFPASIQRAIQVPFEVPDSGLIIVGSIGDEKTIRIAPGKYELLFSVSALNGQKQFIGLDFIKSPKPQAKILIADDELSASLPLLMSASAAGP